MKIINSGFGDIKFVNVQIFPDGFILLGSANDYIGNVDSDDFESATFDVIFNDEKNFDERKKATKKITKPSAQASSEIKQLTDFIKGLDLKKTEKDETFKKLVA